MHEPDILVLGASSFVGGHLMAHLGPRAVGTYASRPRPGLLHFDATTMDVRGLLGRWPITHAVVLLGDTRPDRCAAAPERARALNVLGVCNAINALAEADITPIFTSSEFVFDGERGDYAEEDPAEPILLYGRQKREVERSILANVPRHLIFRLSKVYGLTRGDGTLFTAWREALEAGEKDFVIAADQRFSPIFVDDVVRAITWGVDSGASGLYHLGGPCAMSRFDLFSLVLDHAPAALGRNVRRTRCSIHDFDLAEPRPRDVSLRIDKLTRDFPHEFVTPHTACQALFHPHPEA